MDAPCKIQGSIHVFRLVNNMCPGKWVHIKVGAFFYKKIYYLYDYITLVVSNRSTKNHSTKIAHSNPAVRPVVGVASIKPIS